MRCFQVKVDVSISNLKFLASDLQVFRVSNVNRNMADHDKLMFLWQVYTQLFNHCHQRIHPCGAIVLWLQTTVSTWRQTQTLWLYKFCFCWIYLHVLWFSTSCICPFPALFCLHLCLICSSVFIYLGLSFSLFLFICLPPGIGSPPCLFSRFFPLPLSGLFFLWLCRLLRVLSSSFI